MLIWRWLALSLATLATNIAANVVSPANDFAHLWPKRISFRIGGLITGVIGILMQPWKLIADPSGYIFKWLIAYSALLRRRRRRADRRLLHHPPHAARSWKVCTAREGPYWYLGGFNPLAMIAMLIGIAPCVPGFLATVADFPQFEGFWKDLYAYAWFVSFGLALVSYTTLMLALAPSPLGEGRGEGDVGTSSLRL